MKRLVERFTHSFQAKLLAAFLSLSLIPLVILGYLSFRRSSQALVESAGGVLMSRCQGTVDTIDRNLFERYGDVQAFAFNPLARGTPEEMTSACNYYTQAYGCYDLMVIADKEGRIVAANTVTFDGKPLDTRPLLGRSVRGEPWFDEIISGKIRSGESYTGDLTEDRLVAEVYRQRGLALNFSAPIFDAQGQVVGVWSNRASWARTAGGIMDQLREDYKSQGQTVELQVLARNGVILDDYDPEAVLKLNLVEKGLQAAQQAVKGESGFIIEPHLRRKVAQLNGYASSKGFGAYKGHGWGVLIRKDYADVVAASSELRNFIAICTVVAGIVIAAISYWFGGAITRQVQATVEALRVIARGNFDKTMAVQSQDEFGSLAQEVNNMAGQLAEAGKESGRAVSMLENAPINVMLADADLKITYLNPASTRTLKSIEHLLPVKVENIVGQSIDLFHRNPAHQRKLLADPKNLPHRAVIELGTEKLELTVSAMLDRSGKYLGPMVTWEIVTGKLRMEQEIKDNAEREQKRAQELARIMQAVAANATALGSSAEELTAVSSEMSATAEETAAQANVVSAAAEQVSKNVQTVATGVEEMGASIREIAGNATQAAKVAQEAVKVAETTNSTIAKLGESSNEIGKVIKVITSIAEQTNLLALNATIEAARAGEAGKGFAVVANEVKELAKETAKATEEIGQKIEAIQSDTSGAVSAIRQISQVINQINDISNTIASAVEEQTATTNEISRNVAEAAKGSSEIAQNITSVATAAQNTTQGAGNTQQAAAELSRMAIELQELVRGTAAAGSEAPQRPAEGTVLPRRPEVGSPAVRDKVTHLSA